MGMHKPGIAVESLRQSRAYHQSLTAFAGGGILI